ncbi:hypothetical protein [Burkholderia multivorans]|uniref:hypothetical protein n=1 Tax=Burkholderia multivorans TaxID=87883 RepID=UPI0011B2648B|nr:hypothetical protein [Burkholderia multivorans]
MNAFTPSRVTRFVRIKAVAGPTRAPSGEQTLPAFDTLDQRVGHILAALFMRIKSAREKGAVATTVFAIQSDARYRRFHGV